MATQTLDNPAAIDAGELHEILLRTHAADNIARRRFIDSLRALLDLPRIAAAFDRGEIPYALV